VGLVGLPSLANTRDVNRRPRAGPLLDSGSDGLGGVRKPEEDVELISGQPLFGPSKGLERILDLPQGQNEAVPLTLIL